MQAPVSSQRPEPRWIDSTTRNLTGSTLSLLVVLNIFKQLCIFHMTFSVKIQLYAQFAVVNIFKQLCILHTISLNKNPGHTLQRQKHNFSIPLCHQINNSLNIIHQSILNKYHISLSLTLRVKFRASTPFFFYHH